MNSLSISIWVIIIATLSGGIIFFTAAAIGSYLIDVWNSSESVRSFTYIGLGLGAGFGVFANLYAKKEKK